MQRLLLTLRYDGSRYHGWQVQKNAITVQETLQDAVERLTGIRSGLTGCSRTDAGVHAEMFCCAFDTASPLRGEKMVKALNAHLPRDIAVYGCREVEAVFHPRYAALGKRYVYRIWNAPERNPFWPTASCILWSALWWARCWGFRPAAWRRGASPPYWKAEAVSGRARPLQPAAYIWIMSFIPMKNNAQADFIRL